MKSNITDAGISALLDAGINGPKIEVTQVRIGSDLVAPSASATDVSGFVWQGDSTYIQYQILDEKTFAFKITLDESIGDFPIGNIGLFLKDGTMFTISSLTTQRTKLKNSGTQVGNREVFMIPIVLSGVSGLIDVTVIVPDEASIPFVQNENDLPDPTLAAYSVYEVVYHTILKSSVLALRSNSGWLFVKGQTGSESASFDPGMFEDGVHVGSLVYFDPIADLFRLADGTNKTKGYLGVVGSLYNIVSNGAFLSTDWSLTPGSNYYADGGSNVGGVTTTPNDFYVGKAITNNILLLGNLAETTLNKIQTITDNNPSAVFYPSEKATHDYVMSVRDALKDYVDTQDAGLDTKIDNVNTTLDTKIDTVNSSLTARINQVNSSLLENINTRLLTDESRDVTFRGTVTFTNTIEGTARKALWS